MNCGLRMNYNLNLIQPHIEKPTCFDHLEAFIHQRSRINRNTIPHLPLWMRESLLGSRLVHLSDRSIAERATRGGQKQAFYFASFAGAKALMDSIVFAINWKQRDFFSVH